MEKRSLIVHKYFTEAAQRFDYFVLALIVALIAYLGTDVEFERIGCNVSTLYILTMMVLGISAVSGFKRIEYTVEAHRINHIALDAKEKNNQARADRADELMETVKGRASVSYTIRNIALLLGLICFFMAKILSGYEST